MIDANLTLDQLANNTNGANRLISMIGAKNFVKDTDWVSFKFMRGAANKANYIKITLTPDDLYSVEFGKIHGMNYKVINCVDGLYNDQLFGFFQDETKLALKF